MPWRHAFPVCCSGIYYYCYCYNLWCYPCMCVLKVLKYADTRDIIKGTIVGVCFIPALFHWAPFLHSVWWYTQVSFSAHTLRDDIPHWDAPSRLLLCRFYHKPHPEGTYSALYRLRRTPERRVLPPGNGARERAIGALQSEYPDIFANCKWGDTRW